MKKTLSIAVVALMMAGSSAFACSGCGCEAKKDKEKSGCSSCEKKKTDKKAEKKDTAYKTQTDAQQLACGGSKKDKDKEKTA